MAWEKVDPDEPLSEGDLVEVRHCVQAPRIPFNELLARFAVEKAKLTGEINAELPECMKATVQDTTLERSRGVVVNGDECEFMHTTTLRITELEDGCTPISAASLGQVVVIALSALVVLLGVSLVFYQARKFIQSPGGEETAKNVSTAALLVAAGWTFTQFAGEDGDLA